jgi:hypothetical protein
MAEKTLEDYLAEAAGKGIDISKAGAALAELGIPRGEAKRAWVEYTIKTTGTERKATEDAVEELLAEQYDSVKKG